MSGVAVGRYHMVQLSRGVGTLDGSGEGTHTVSNGTIGGRALVAVCRSAASLAVPAARRYSEPHPCTQRQLTLGRWYPPAGAVRAVVAKGGKSCDSFAGVPRRARRSLGARCSPSVRRGTQRPCARARFRSMVRECEDYISVICGGNAAAHGYLVDWLAQMLQQVF